MNNCVSRQAAIDAIGEKSDEIYKTKQKGATYPHDDFFQGMAYAENVVKQLPPAQPEPQTARVFQEIIVEYPSISTYPEYEGKPYFSIKYMEDGKSFIGYGTYKPEVLSEYLIKYFMPFARPEPYKEVTNDRF